MYTPARLRWAALAVLSVYVWSENRVSPDVSDVVEVYATELSNRQLQTAGASSASPAASFAGVDNFADSQAEHGKSDQADVPAAANIDEISAKPASEVATLSSDEQSLWAAAQELEAFDTLSDADKNRVSFECFEASAFLYERFRRFAEDLIYANGHDGNLPAGATNYAIQLSDPEDLTVGGGIGIPLPAISTVTGKPVERPVGRKSRIESDNNPFNDKVQPLCRQPIEFRQRLDCFYNLYREVVYTGLAVPVMWKMQLGTPWQVATVLRRRRHQHLMFAEKTVRDALQAEGTTPDDATAQAKLSALTPEQRWTDLYEIARNDALWSYIYSRYYPTNLRHSIYQADWIETAHMVTMVSHAPRPITLANGQQRPVSCMRPLMAKYQEYNQQKYRGLLGNAVLAYNMLGSLDKVHNKRRVEKGSECAKRREDSLVVSDPATDSESEDAEQEDSWMRQLFWNPFSSAYIANPNYVSYSPMSREQCMEVYGDFGYKTAHDNMLVAQARREDRTRLGMTDLSPVPTCLKGGFSIDGAPTPRSWRDELAAAGWSDNQRPVEETVGWACRDYHASFLKGIESDTEAERRAKGTGVKAWRHLGYVATLAENVEVGDLVDPLANDGVKATSGFSRAGLAWKFRYMADESRTQMRINWPGVSMDTRTRRGRVLGLMSWAQDLVSSATGSSAQSGDISDVDPTKVFPSISFNGGTSFTCSEDIDQAKQCFGDTCVYCALVAPESAVASSTLRGRERALQQQDSEEAPSVQVRMKVGEIDAPVFEKKMGSNTQAVPMAGIATNVNAATLLNPSAKKSDEESDTGRMALTVALVFVGAIALVIILMGLAIRMHPSEYVRKQGNDAMAAGLKSVAGSSDSPTADSLASRSEIGDALQRDRELDSMGNVVRPKRPGSARRAHARNNSRHMTFNTIATSIPDEDALAVEQVVRPKRAKAHRSAHRSNSRHQTFNTTATSIPDEGALGLNNVFTAPEVSSRHPGDLQ